MYTEDICVIFKNDVCGQHIRGVIQITWYENEVSIMSIYDDFKFKTDDVACIICGLR